MKLFIIIIIIFLCSCSAYVQNIRDLRECINKLEAANDNQKELSLVVKYLLEKDSLQTITIDSLEALNILGGPPFEIIYDENGLPINVKFISEYVRAEK